jgi:chaperonin GroES
MTELRPLNDRVVVKRVDSDTVTKGGLVIPDTVAEKPDQGVVLAVGKGKKDRNGDYIPLEVKVADRVLFGKHAGTQIKHQGEDLLVLKEDEIFAVFN